MLSGMLTSLKIADRKERNALIVWVVITLALAAQSYFTHHYNNYLIFSYVYENLIHHRSLYAYYPEWYRDVNHYGPVFAFFIMPFAVLPEWLGFFLWDLFNTLFLFYAIRSLAIPGRHRVYYFLIPCLVSSLLSEQFNPCMAAMLIFSYSLLNGRRSIWATCCIALGTLIKLYGIVGLAFFFFVKKKWRYSLSLILWFVVLLALPVLVVDKAFLINTYHEWFLALVEKNGHNLASPFIDISFMGMIRSAFGQYHWPNLPFLLFGAAVFALPYLNSKSYACKGFQHNILAATLIFVVLFSTCSEDCTYIIAATGAGIYLASARPGRFNTLLGLSVMLACLSLPAIFFASYARAHPFAMRCMAIPISVIWLKITLESMLWKPVVIRNTRLPKQRIDALEA